METGLTFSHLHQKLSECRSDINACAVINLGILTRSYNSLNWDAELYAVFKTDCDAYASYLAFTDLVEQLFPGYQILVYTERDADHLHQSVFDEMIFLFN